MSSDFVALAALVAKAGAAGDQAAGTAITLLSLLLCVEDASLSLVPMRAWISFRVNTAEVLIVVPNVSASSSESMSGLANGRGSGLFGGVLMLCNAIVGNATSSQTTGSGHGCPEVLAARLSIVPAAEPVLVASGCPGVPGNGLFGGLAAT